MVRYHPEKRRIDMEKFDEGKYVYVVLCDITTSFGGDWGTSLLGVYDSYAEAMMVVSTDIMNASEGGNDVHGYTEKRQDQYLNQSAGIIVYKGETDWHRIYRIYQKRIGDRPSTTVTE
jgi:hypothetical protein